MTDGHLVWENDNYIYVNDTESNWNNVSTGAIIENKWYAQPVYSGSCVIIYDINSGKKVGRIENQSFSILTKETCWAVGNKLYVLTEVGYFNCYEIEGKSKNENIIIIFFILFTGNIVIYVVANNKRKKKKVKEKIFNSIVVEISTNNGDVAEEIIINSELASKIEELYVVIVGSESSYCQTDCYNLIIFK